MSVASDTSRQLEACIEGLAQKLLPNGHRDGHYWVEARRDRGGLGDSLKVDLRKATWRHYAAGVGGDALDLVAYLLFRGDLGDALRWARDWLGIERLSRDELKAERLKAEELQAARREDAAARAEKMHGAATRIFLEAEARIAGTPVDDYLRGRGIELTRLGRQPRALRFHPRLWNRESQQHRPAMVAAICSAAGALDAVHRTWLAQIGGTWKKAPLEHAKLSLGNFAGGCIRLWRGAAQKALRDARQGEEVVIGEGIEDCLTAAIAAPELRVLCAVSGGNMAGMILPPQIGGVILLGQNEDNPAARRHWGGAVRNFAGQGKRVRMAQPACAFKDINELHQWDAAVERAAE